jgi:hypothetical protein
MAGTEPHAWGAGRMDDITYVGLDVHKPALAKAGGDGVRGSRRERDAVVRCGRSGFSRTAPRSVSPPLIDGRLPLFFWLVKGDFQILVRPIRDIGNFAHESKAAFEDGRRSSVVGDWLG